jgi:hypothetical protein
LSKISPIEKNESHSYKSRDPGAYIKHPERGPDVFVGGSKSSQHEDAQRELVCRVDNNFSKERAMQIERSNHILNKAKIENEAR